MLTRWSTLATLGFFFCSAAPYAQESDEGALKIADQAPDTKVEASDWHAFVEGGLTDARLRYGGSQLGERLSFDVHDDSVLAPGVRFILADRLDLEHIDHPEANNNFNTIKEAYFSWQPEPALILDAGRINLRYGVATGYNPTDFFRTDAIRSVVSLDPSSLRENRQGTVMVQGQWLTDGGSISALVAPKLADDQNQGTFSPDFGATNGSQRWLVAGSARVIDGISPQVLVFGGERQSTQLGANLSLLATQAMTTYIEWSAGDQPTLRDEAFGVTGGNPMQRRFATGATYTFDFNMTWTLEYDSNSAGLDLADLSAIGRGPPGVLPRLLGAIEEQQDLPTRRGWFSIVSVTDAFVQHLDLSTFVRYDPISHSRLQWGEARYHFDHADLAMQLEFYSGSPRSIYGAVPAQRTVELLLRYFL